jgi:hypothetical protein
MDDDATMEIEREYGEDPHGDFQVKAHGVLPVLSTLYSLNFQSGIESPQ